MCSNHKIAVLDTMGQNPGKYRLGNLFMDKVSGDFLGLIALDKNNYDFIPIGTPKINHTLNPAGTETSMESFRATTFELKPLPVGWQAVRIPLTDQFLERFMFRKDMLDPRVYDYLDPENAHPYLPFRRIHIRLIAMLHSGWLIQNRDFNTIIYFVDQLQNYFYSIAHEELPNSHF